MLTFWCFTIAAAATLLTGHSPLAGLVAGLAAAAARHLLPRAVAFGTTHRPQRRSGGNAPSPTSRRVGSMRAWRSIPMPGRIIIVAVAVLVFAVAGVACATSYNAIYRLVGMLGLYGKDITKVFPLMLEVAFIGCELAANLGVILRALNVSRLRFPPGMDPDDIDDAIREARRQVSRGWPAWTMLCCGMSTIAFNVAHAWLLSAPAQSPAPGLQVVSGTGLIVWRCVVAAFPPLVMMLFFQVLIAIVKWTMVTIGRPLHTGAALAPTMMLGYGPDPSEQTAYSGWDLHRSDAPESVGAASASAKVPISDTGFPSRSIEDNKADIVRAFLRGMPPDRFARATKSSVAKELRRDAGLIVDETWCSRLLSEVRAERNGNR